MHAGSSLTHLSQDVTNEEGLLRRNAALARSRGQSGGRHVTKILVAEDNTNVQNNVNMALAELGVDVVAVNNGEAAVRKLSDFLPDLILADIFMPVRNGY